MAGKTEITGNENVLEGNSRYLIGQFSELSRIPTWFLNNKSFFNPEAKHFLSSTLKGVEV